MTKSPLVLFLVFFFALPVFAQQVDTAWVRRYNGPGNGIDEATAIAVDGSGNIYVTGGSWGNGTRSDYATIKYDPAGNQLWLQRYNGVLSGYDANDDRATAMAVDGSGNVYVTGWSDGSGTQRDYATIKYDPAGNQLWVQKYNDPSNYYDVAYAIAVDGSGNVYVTGLSHGGGTNLSDYATIKYDPQGNELWVQRYSGLPGYNDDRATAIVVDGSGNVCVTGYSADSGIYYYDYATLKYDPDGNQLWEKRYNGPGNYEDQAYAIAVDGSGNVYVTGESYGSGRTGYDYATLKYDPAGNQLWVQRYSGLPGYNDDRATAIVVDGSGNVYVTGGSNEDYATIKYWQNYPPNLFSLISPSDSVIIPYIVFFDWEDAIDPDPWDTVRYDLYISTSPTFHPDSTIIYDSLLTSQYTDTLNTGRYYWKVRAYDKHSEMWSNQILTFRVQDYPPNAFSLLSPSDSSMIPYIVAFDWETAIDPDPWDTAKYDLYVSTSSIFNPDSTAIYDSLLSSQHTDTLGLGRYFWKVRAYDSHLQTWSSQTWTFLSAIWGDANSDKKVTVADVIYLINFLFKSGPAPNPFQAGNVNCDSYVTVSDVVYLINYLFKGGLPPCS